MKKVVLVTGASKGIGREVARQLKKMGYWIYLHGRNESELLSLQSELNQENSIFKADFMRDQDVTDLIQSVKQSLAQSQAHLCGLVNNAGIFKPQNSLDQNHELWITQFQINLLSSVHLTEGLLPELLQAAGSNKNVSIVNIASTLGSKTSSGTGAYGASKAAMIHWTHTLALELGAKGVRANVVCPGLVDTPIHAFHFLAPKEKQARLNELSQIQPLGRVGAPEDVAGAVCYLMSEQAQWVTGSTLNVDGGINLT